MLRPRPRALLDLMIAAACVFSTGTGSAIAEFTSSAAATSNGFTAGYWGSCTAGSATLSVANGKSVVDTYVDHALPNATNATNATKATAQTLNVTASTGASNARMLIKFSSLPTISSPCVFKTTTLNLNKSSSGHGSTYSVYNVAAAWTDTTVTWNNQPATAGSPVSGSSANGVNKSVTWDVSTLVSAQYAGSNNGLLIKDAGDGSASASTSFSSNEANQAADRPTLEITWGP